MKITGVAIIRNAIKNDYPVVEAINSILPMVDEMVVSIDRGEDDTEALIRSMDSDKIKIFFSEWDMTLREGGRVYAVETDKAIAHVSADTDWIFYIQADEVIHEQYHAAILEAAKKHKDNKAVQGLLFNYLHFYGTYDYLGDSRGWYNHEVRIIRNDSAITSYRDAQGFRVGKTKLKVASADAAVYHYGWVKSPELMKQKQKNVLRYYSGDDTKVDTYLKSADFFDYSQFDSLRKFTGTHPQVMKNRIAAKNWHVELDISQKKFRLKGKILFWLEQKTGKRFFDFRNYKLLKG